MGVNVPDTSCVLTAQRALDGRRLLIAVMIIGYFFIINWDATGGVRSLTIIRGEIRMFV